LLGPRWKKVKARGEVRNNNDEEKVREKEKAGKPH
jgi:hypothetical protein